MSAAWKLLKNFKWVLILLAAAAFLFYWYEVRPIRIYRMCIVQSSADARGLLRSKAEIAQGTAKGDSYQALIDKNMYLRSDYESFMTKCLRYHGFDKTKNDPEVAPPAEEAANE